MFQETIRVKARMPGKRFDTWMLNLRFTLIVLVFTASGIEPLIGHFGGLEALHTWIFLFHIPLFAFVTGYFARPNLLGKTGLRTLGSLFVQYFLFQSLYSAVDALFFHTPAARYSFFLPYMMLWFIMAHIGWRIVMIAMVRLRIRHPLLWTAAIGVASGYWAGDGSWLSLSRMCVFLPFFAAGYVLPPALIASLYSRSKRPVLGAAAFLLLAAAVMAAWKETPGWLYGKYTYAQLHAAGVQAAIIRLGWYAAQVAGAVCFVAWVPRRASILTVWGTRTVYVFLLHGILLRLAALTGLYGTIHTWAGVLLLISAVLTCTVLLSLPQTRRATAWLVEPQWESWLRSLYPLLQAIKLSWSDVFHGTRFRRGLK